MTVLAVDSEGSLSPEPGTTEADNLFSNLAGEITTEQGFVVYAVKTDDATLASSLVSTLMTALATRNLKRLFAADVTIEGNYTQEDLDRGIRVRIPLPDVVENGTYVVLHRKSDGEWEELDYTAENGAIIVTMHSFSPVIVNSADPVNLDEGNGSTLTAGVTSPKTGETVPFAAVLSVALFAGAAVCAAKRVKFN
jgi:hypothetical protein